MKFIYLFWKFRKKMCKNKWESYRLALRVFKIDALVLPEQLDYPYWCSEQLNTNARKLHLWSKNRWKNDRFHVWASTNVNIFASEWESERMCASVWQTIRSNNVIAQMKWNEMSYAHSSLARQFITKANCLRSVLFTISPFQWLRLLDSFLSLTVACWNWTKKCLRICNRESKLIWVET